jgi:hypothetical protein
MIIPDTSIVLIVERDQASGEFAISYDARLGYLHGSGPTFLAAINDLMDTTREYRDMMAERTKDGTLGQNQVGHPALVAMMLDGDLG